MKTKRILLLTLCMVALVLVSVVGTIAFFTDRDSVTNTFTVGNIEIALDEAEVNPDGTLASNDRVKANTYHLLPGLSYIKDPTMTVKAGSEEAYLRLVVKVTRFDELEAALEGGNYFADLNGDGDPDVDLRLLLNDTWNYAEWQFAGYTEDGTTAAYEFRYVSTVDMFEEKNDAKLAPLFTEIAIPGSIDNAHMAHLGNVVIDVEGHAIQAAGFDSADEAWAEFN